MSNGFRQITREDLNQALERVLFADLADILKTRQRGHCMKVTDLDLDVMTSLAPKLQEAVPESMVHILSRESSRENSFAITSTKVVELRNPLPNGELRPPLLVFVPNDLRTASEDSFGVATFEEIRVAHAYEALKADIEASLPGALRNAINELLRQVSARHWKWSDLRAQVRYLLTLAINGPDEEVAGAALYELGLTPDLKLIENGALSVGRLLKHLKCLEILTFSQKSERGRLLDLGLSNKSFRSELAEFLVDSGLEDPAVWTRRIASDTRDRKFWYDKWDFEGGSGTPEKICLEVTDIALPYIAEDEEDPKLQNLVGQQVLIIGPTGTNRLGVTFRATPAPAQVQALAGFQLQILSKDGTPIGVTKRKAAWKGGRQEANVSFTRLNRVEWEEGWHFVRVTAYTEIGDPFPLVDSQGNPVLTAGMMDSGVRSPHESDLFYVIPGEDIEIEPPQRAIPRHPSFVHAAVHLRFSALSAGRNPDGIKAHPVTWSKDGESRGRVQNDIIQAKFGREGLVNIPVSRALRVLEQRILSFPRDPISWTLPINYGNAEGALSGESGWPKNPEVEPFLQARTRYFNAIRLQHESAISQGADLSVLRAEVVEYAASYVSLVQNLLRRAETSEGPTLQVALLDLRKVLALDRVTLDISNHRGVRKYAALAGPTHPLRALWLVAWCTVANSWLESAKCSEKERVIPTREALIDGLSLLHFPAVLPVDRGSLYVGVDSIHPFWTLYAPPGEEDPRGVIGEVCAALGLAEPSVGNFSLNGQHLADRVRRYLIQHPYIDTLTINAFNAGRGGVLAEMLLSLQKRPEFENLKYNIRLFVPDPDLPDVGQDVEELLRPGSQPTAQEADAFCSPTGSHLFPKLSLALRSTDDFRSAPTEYSAHITMLFDAFPAQEIGAAAATPETEASPIHGLFQDFSVSYADAEDEIGWHRQPRHGEARPLPDAEELTDLLSRLPALLSSAAATVATGVVGPKFLPVIKLTLTAADKALIHQVHETSDWVFTIDRNMGIEFFDHDGTGDRPEYLIDYSPQLGSSSGRRMVITSRSLTEVEALLNTVLQDYQLSVDNERAAAVLTQLRSLSGRLALKLISSRTNRAEAFGLALARMYLDYQGALRNQIIVPLDAHLELYRVLRRNADELGNEVSLRRTDLAVFDLNAANRVITCNLVEVKCYRDVGGVGALTQLMESIADQIHQSERVLRIHFDPTWLPSDRPDRLVKTQELATLLEFYLDRAARFSLVTPDVWNEGKYLLRTLEAGYSLDFTRSAIIFDFEKAGTDVTEEQAGIEYHRIGIDLIRDLLAAFPARKRVSRAGSAPEPPPGDAEVPEESGAQKKLGSTLPRLTRAAFLPPKRDHSVSWDKARARASDFSRERDSESDDTEIQVRHEPPSKPVTPPALSEPQVSTHSKVEPPAQPVPQPPKAIQDSKNVHPATQPNHQAEKALPGEDAPACDVLLGDDTSSVQFGLLGKCAGRTVGLDLNHPQTISLFGVQGGGKSYTLGSIVEMATARIPAINNLASPLASVIFHYSPTQDYEPEFTSMHAPNADAAALATLERDYGGKPQGLADILLLTPADKLHQRREQFPVLEVRPLKFASSELGASHWKFLMGAVGNQAAYFRQLNRLMRGMRGNLSLAALREGVAHSALPDHIKDLASMRLDLAASYIDDSQRLGDILRPGRLVIVDLRDEFIEKDEALGLFVVLLQLFADTKYQGKDFNKLVVFDEAHKYIDSPDLVAGLVEVVREMRHKGTSILVASQDPPSVPVSLIELSTQIIMHKFNSPAWLKHIQKANSALTSLTAEQMARLNAGEAYVWSSRATDPAFSRGALKITCRPRVTQHGGATKTAVMRCV